MTVSYAGADRIATIDLDGAKANVLTPAVIVALDARLTRAEGPYRIGLPETAIKMALLPFALDRARGEMASRIADQLTDDVASLTTG